MKTLKFMLAAATALGLASAYAEPAAPSTTFETMPTGTQVTTGTTDSGTTSGTSYYTFTGAEGDNESEIVEFDVSSIIEAARPKDARGTTRQKVLQVSTGAQPLLRNVQASGEPMTLSSDMFVDTLVQFTVTPVSDSVTPGQDDKLMIYLKESTNTVGEVSTNLVVWGGYCYDDYGFEPHEFVVANKTIDPNTWYRLTVKAMADYGNIEDHCHPAFSIFIDGDICTFNDYAVKEAGGGDHTFIAPFDSDEFETGDLIDAAIVFSLKCDGDEAASLTAVGFAGEGKVDDLMITTADPFVTAVDFTLALDATISSVSVLVNGTTEYSANGTYDVYPGDEITISSVAYATGYVAGPNSITASGFAEGEGYVVGTTACSLSFSGIPATYTIAYELGGGTAGSGSAQSYTYSASSQTKTVADPTRTDYNFTGWTISPNTVTIDGATLTIPAGTTGTITLTASWEAAQSGWDPNPSVIPDNTPAGEKYTQLAGTALATADAKELTMWATAKEVDFADVTAAPATYVDAFLLNCTLAQVAAKKDAFELTITFTAAGVPVVNLPDGFEHNGTLTLKGSTDLSTWTTVGSGSASTDYNFYKYELSL